MDGEGNKPLRVEVEERRRVSMWDGVGGESTTSWCTKLASMSNPDGCCFGFSRVCRSRTLHEFPGLKRHGLGRIYFDPTRKRF